MERNTVAVVPCPDYDPERVRAALTEAIEAAGGLDWVTPGMRVGIKLNLCDAAAPEAAATTHPVMAAELTKLLVEKGAKVILGDSPGGPFVAAHINRLYSVCGMAAAEEAGGELNRCYTHSSVDFPEAATYKSFYLCDWLINCDAVINFCKLKTHGMMGMSACVKNMFGVIPGTYKPEYHYKYPKHTQFADMLVDLNERCKQQQMGEGWFATIDDVPKQAVSMTTYQIMQCKRIVSCVPHAVKAEAIKNTVKAQEVTNMVPATLLKTHPDFILYVDENSASGILA